MLICLHIANLFANNLHSAREKWNKNKIRSGNAKFICAATVRDGIEGIGKKSHNLFDARMGLEEFSMEIRWTESNIKLQSIYAAEK